MLNRSVRWPSAWPLLPLLLFAVAHAVLDTALLFNGPYRNEAQTSAPIPTRFTDSTSGISFQGWAQIPSGPAQPTRPLFQLQSGAVQLLAVYVQDDQHLAVSVATASGAIVVTGLNLSADSWISFGITITSNQVDLRAVTLAATGTVSQTSAAASITLGAAPILTGPAVAIAPSMTPQATSTLAYLTTLRVVLGPLAPDTFTTLSSLFPAPYWTRVGADVTGLVFERSAPSTNVTCLGGDVFSVVRAAYYGRPFGVWPQLHANPSCDSGELALAVMQSACLGRTSCVIPQSNTDFNFDPCSARKKFVAFAMTCSGQGVVPSPTPSAVPSTLAPSTARPQLSGSPALAQVAIRSSSPTAAPSSTISSSPPSSSSAPLSPRATIPNAQAWQVTFQMFVSTLGPGQYVLRNALVRDLAAVLNVPTSRFARVEFRDQTETATVVSIVIVADIAADPDGTLLLDAFCQGLQTPGSAVRTVTVLSTAPPPPIPMQVSQIRLEQEGCDTSGGKTCPNAATAYSSGQEARLFWFGAIVGVCVVLTVVICWWVRVVHPGPKHGSVPVPTSFRAVMDDGKLAAPVSFGTHGAGTASIWGQSQQAPLGAPYPPVAAVVSCGSGGAAAYPPALMSGQHGSYFSQNDLGDVALEVATVPALCGDGAGPAVLSLSMHSSRAALVRQQQRDAPDF